ncbi:MAG: hypothetical protein ACJAYX_003736 [Planctomycetota bacterium]|jgi:hypothetical protein
MQLDTTTVASTKLAVAITTALLAMPAFAQSTQGPTSSQTPYLQITAPAGVVTNVTSIATTLDLVPTTNNPNTPYEIAGIIDGLGAYDNGDGTITVLATHELGSSSGVVRRHGSNGTFIAELIIDKVTLEVVSASDLTERYIDSTGTVRSAAAGNGLTLNRFCSGDLPAASAFFNAATGLGSQDRIFMCGEEGGSTGYAIASVATGTEKGTAYVLPAFNLATNGSGVNAIGAWENLLANPFAQDLTIVAGNNDGGSSVMNNRISLYVGTKQATGDIVEKAGLMNGTNYLIQVAGNPDEIVDSATRATNIVNGTRFNLDATEGTRFSRPEDGAWDPNEPRDYYFVTTDRLDSSTSTGSNPTVGASSSGNVGMSRLFRLRFDDIANPALGGVIEILVDGGKLGQKVNMLDNMCVGDDGRVYMTEDPGNSAYLAKVWVYDPTTDTLLQLFKMDEARWGELAAAGGTPGAMAPQTNNKEISGVVDVTRMFPHAVGESVFLIDVQDHSNNPAVASASSAEGGQLLLFRVALDGRTTPYGLGCGLTLGNAPGSKPVLGNTLFAQVGGIVNSNPAFMMVGTSSSSFGSGPLPLSLDMFGLTGCFLNQDISLESFGPTIPVGFSTAIYTLPIPSASSFAGLEVFCQAYSADMAANPYGVVLSNGLSVVLGF